MQKHQAKLSLLKPVGGYLIWGFILMLIVVSIQLAVPYIFGLFIDGKMVPKDLNSLIYLSSILFGVAIAYCAANSMRFYLFDIAGNQIVMTLRERLFSNLMRQEIGFFDGEKVGTLTSRLSSDVEALRDTLTVEIGFFVRTTISAIGGTVLLVILSWQLSLVLLVILPLSVIIGKKYGGLAHNSAEELQNELAKSLDVAQESLTNVRQVQAFNKTESVIKKFNYVNRSAKMASNKQSSIQAWFQANHNFLGYIVTLLLIAIGGYQVVNNAMSVGELTSFILYSTFTSAGYIGLLEIWNNWKTAEGASEALFSLIARTPKQTNALAEQMSPPILGDIEFKDVSFSYPQRPDQKALSNINFSIKQGQSIALVGASGSGKSTVASLLLAHYSPLCGNIFIDGINMSTMNVNQLRNHCAIVEQEPNLFSGSILENIKFGAIDSKHVNTQDVIEAAKQANAHQFIMDFEVGYDTEVGQNGVQLSGGQKQRIAIARAILRSPSILILDEATSALDSNSETLVQEALNELMKNRTTLIIAHRYSTFASADKVIVMQNGSVIQSGTHQELLHATSRYYRNIIEGQLNHSAA
jgi:ATP-binding cassette subfamily B protein